MQPVVLICLCCAAVVGGLAGTAAAQRSSALLDPLPAAERAAADSTPDLYGWLLGDWDIDVTDYLPDGTSHSGTGEWHFGWVLQGGALQDVWISPRRGERPPAEEPPGPRNRYGTTIRFYDPSIHAWRVTWVNPAQNYVATLVGRAVGRDIVQEGTGEGGALLRWTFTEITPTGFRGRGETSKDSGRTWSLTQEMRGRRAPRQASTRMASAAALMDALLADGPAGIPADVASLFGQFVGSWEGTVAGRNPDGSWTTGPGELHFDWVLEGRAIQDVWIFPTRGTAQGPTPADEYGSNIRFYDPSAGNWRVVWVSPVNHLVAVFRARRDGDEVFVEWTTPRGQPQRFIFSDIARNTFRWRNIVLADSGRTWQRVETVEVHRIGVPPPGR